MRLHACPVLLSTVPSGLPLVQPSKRSHMHLSTSALSNASAGLHYSMPPCHYSNQQTTYGMMAGVLGRLAVRLRQSTLQKLSFKAWLSALSDSNQCYSSSVSVTVDNDDSIGSLSPAQEMLSASISQTRILQTCSVPHNMVNGPNSLQGTVFRTEHEPIHFLLLLFEFN